MIVLCNYERSASRLISKISSLHKNRNSPLVWCTQGDVRSGQRGVVAHLLGGGRPHTVWRRPQDDHQTDVGNVLPLLPPDADRSQGAFLATLISADSEEQMLLVLVRVQGDLACTFLELVIQTSVVSSREV